MNCAWRCVYVIVKGRTDAQSMIQQQRERRQTRIDGDKKNARERNRTNGRAVRTTPPLRVPVAAAKRGASVSTAVRPSEGHPAAEKGAWRG